MYVCFGNRIMLHLRLTAQRYLSLKISFIKQRRTLIMKYLWCSRGSFKRLRLSNGVKVHQSVIYLCLPTFIC